MQNRFSVCLFPPRGCASIVNVSSCQSSDRNIATVMPRGVNFRDEGRTQLQGKLREEFVAPSRPRARAACGLPSATIDVEACCMSMLHLSRWLHHRHFLAILNILLMICTRHLNICISSASAASISCSTVSLSSSHFFLH